MMTAKEKYVRMGLGIVAGVAAYRFRKYRWAASVLVSVAANGIQAGIEAVEEKRHPVKPKLEVRKPDSSYL